MKNIDDKDTKKRKPLLMVFFNNLGGALWFAHDVFDFEALEFKTYPGCAFEDELSSVVWHGIRSTQRGVSDTIVGYSQKYQMGFMPVDLRQFPKDERQDVHPDQDQYLEMAYLLNKHFPQKGTIHVLGGEPPPKKDEGSLLE